MSKPRLKELTAMEPYKVALQESRTKEKTATGGRTQPLTIDDLEKRDMTYLEQTNGAQAERDAADHEAAVKAQETARETANREAYIGHELMQKYLPQYQAMQGTGGMGTSGTDATAAFNAYLGRVSGNNAVYAQNVAALDRQKTETDRLREAEYRDMVYGLKHEYDSERLAAQQEESGGLLGLMSSRANQYKGSDGKLSQEDYDNLASFYRVNASRLTEADKRNAQDMLEEYRLAIRETEEQAAMDRLGFIKTKGKVSKAPAKYEAGKNFEITGADGEKYRVQISGEATDEAVLREAGKVDSGEMFGYGGRLYVRNQDKVYAVEERSNSYKDEFSSLYDLYFGHGKNDADQEAVAIPRGNSNYREGATIRAKSQNSKTETVTVGAKVEHIPFPLEYMETGVIYDINGERIIKDASGVVYKVK